MTDQVTEQISEQKLTLRDLYERHLMLAYKATRADLDLKAMIDENAARVEVESSKVRLLALDSEKALTAYKQALTDQLIELKAPVGYSLDVFGDGTLKPAVACLQPDGRPPSPPQGGKG